MACSASGEATPPAVDPAAGGGYPRLADHDRICRCHHHCRDDPRVHLPSTPPHLWAPNRRHAGGGHRHIGCVLPSFVIVLTLAFCYYKYKNLTVVQGALSCLRPAVVSLIANAGLAILLLAVFGGKTFSGQVNPVAIGIIWSACSACANGTFPLRSSPALAQREW